MQHFKALLRTYNVNVTALLHVFPMSEAFFFQSVSERLHLCPHADGRHKEDHWDHTVSVDNLYLFFCPGWKICYKSLGFL